MSISKIRTFLYKTAKYLGDFNAIQRSIQKKDVTPIVKRVIRRIYGYIASKGMPK